MTTATLREIIVEFDLSDEPDLPVGRPPRTEHGEALRRKYVAADRRMQVIRMHMMTALRRERAVVGTPPASILNLVLTSSPGAEAVRIPPPATVLRVEVAFDRDALLDAPVDRDTLGRLHLSFFRDAAEPLGRVAGFPLEAWTRACDAYRAQDHGMSFVAGSRLVPGTRLKGTVRVQVDAAQTRRWLDLSHRGTHLARAPLGTRDEPDLAAGFFDGFMLDGTEIAVKGNRHDGILPGGRRAWPLERVDLRDDPDVLALAREKGWLAP